MKDLVLYIVTNIVSKPDAVSVDEQRNGTDVLLHLTVDPEDMGVVIGRSGQTIKAIRKLLTVRAISENVRINLQLVEPAQSEIPAETATEASEEITKEVPAEAPAETTDETPANEE